MNDNRKRLQYQFTLARTRRSNTHQNTHRTTSAHWPVHAGRTRTQTRTKPRAPIGQYTQVKHSLKHALSRSRNCRSRNVKVDHLTGKVSSPIRSYAAFFGNSPLANRQCCALRKSSDFITFISSPCYRNTRILQYLIGWPSDNRHYLMLFSKQKLPQILYNDSNKQALFLFNFVVFF